MLWIIISPFGKKLQYIIFRLKLDQVYVIKIYFIGVDNNNFAIKIIMLVIGLLIFQWFIDVKCDFF